LALRFEVTSAYRPSRFALLLLGLSLIAPAHARAETRWRPSPQAINSLYSIAYGNGLFLALNIRGRVLVSEDGLTWKERPIGAKGRLNMLIHADGRFLGVGDSGTVMTSADGVAWTSRNPGTIVDLHAVAHRNGLYLAVGDEGTILTSIDGTTWIKGKSKYTGRLASAAVGDRGYVVAGACGSRPFIPDGIACLSGSAPVTANKVIYSENRYLAVGKAGAIRISLDGNTWEEAVAPGAFSLHDVIRGPDQYLAVGDSGTALVSRDGRVWSRHAMGSVWPGAGPASMISVAYGGGRYVAVGTNGALMVSTNGQTWTALDFHLGSSRSVAFGAGRYVAVGADDVSLSADGVLWTSWDFGIPGRFSMNSIRFDKGRFLAVGDGGAILTSPDGGKWKMVLRDTLGYRLLDVVLGGSGYVAVGTGRPVLGNGEEYRSAGGFILTSRDGNTWTPHRNTVYDDLFSVAYGNGRYVAAGEDGRVLSSPDGKVWTFRKSGSEERLFSVAYGAGLFVVVGWGGTILTSPDGVAWTDRSVHLERFLSHVIYNGRQFVAMGAASAICASTDGIRWKLAGTSLRHGLPGGLAFGRPGHVVRESYGKAGYTPDSVVSVDPASRRDTRPPLSVEVDGASGISVDIPPELRASRISVTVSDMEGRKLLENRMAGSVPEIYLPLSDLTRGSFQVEIESDSGSGMGEFYFPQEIRKRPVTSRAR
jgi:hypothetical protein